MDFLKNDKEPDLSKIDKKVVFDLSVAFFNHTLVANEKLRGIIKALLPLSEYQSHGYNLDVIVSNTDDNGVNWTFDIVAIPVDSMEAVAKGEEVEYIKIYNNSYMLDDSRTLSIKQNSILLSELIILVLAGLRDVEIDLNLDMSKVSLDMLNNKNFLGKFDDESPKLKKKDF